MGLGKTLQVIALLLVAPARRDAVERGDAPTPARRAGLAARELEGGDRALRPGAAVLVAHPSAMPRAELEARRRRRSRGIDLVSPPTASLRECRGCASATWELVVLDEAQAIKNPGTSRRAR